MSSKDLSVIFPIYNEEKTIKNTLLEWKKSLDQLSINYEMIIAEDGSTDGTKKILFSLIRKNKKKFITNIIKEKRGYSEAVISSGLIAKGKFILSVDSDGQCDPKDFIKFWKKRNLLNNTVIIGNRVNRKDFIMRFLMSKSFFIIHKILFPSKIKDPSCPYIFSHKKNFVNITRKISFMIEGFWWGFVAVCLKKKIKIYQVNINHRVRLEGQTNVFHLNKIPQIALRNIYGLIKIRFSKVNY